MGNAPKSDPHPGLRPFLPDWGVYLRWPENGEKWIHPDDVQLTCKLIPSARVFRRSKWDGRYYSLHYGELMVRVKPTMWVAVPTLDLCVGQKVEVLSRLRENDPGIFQIRDILFNSKRGVVEYFIRRGELRLARSFGRHDLRPIQVRYHLRSGYFQHQPPRAALPEDLETLDVGNLFEDEK